MNQNTEEIFPKRRKDFWQDSRYATRYANSVESTTSDLNDVVASTSICRDWLGVQPRSGTRSQISHVLRSLFGFVDLDQSLLSFCKLYSEEKELLWPDSLFKCKGFHLSNDYIRYVLI